MKLTDQLRCIADQFDQQLFEPVALHPDLEALWPTAANLIGGVQPTAPTLVPGDVDGGAVNLVHYDRLVSAMPAGAVMFFGDSIVQAMPVCLASPFGINLGYGGSSTRRLLHHMLRPAYRAALERASAGVILTGPNDVGNIGYYGSWENAADTVVIMFANHIRNWITGRWVLVCPMPGDQRVPGMPQYYNAAMQRIGAGLISAFAQRQHVSVLSLWSDMVDETGNLKASFHIGDGQHLSSDGYAVLCQGIRSALNHQ